MEKKPEPILEIDLGENGGKAIFTSFEEAQQWVQKENQFWNWFPNEARSDQNLNDLWNHIKGLLSRMQKELNNAGPNVSDPTWKGFASSLKQRIADCYGATKNALPHSESARARFIEELKKGAPLSAAYAAAYFMGRNMQPVQAIAFRGIVEAYLFDEGLLEKGVRENANSEIRALRDLRTEWDNTIGSLKTDATIVQNQFVDTKDKADSLLTDQQKAHGELMKGQGEAFARTLDEGKTKLKEIEDTYNSFMVLQAPVTYWEGEQTRHQDLAKHYGKRSTVFGIIVIIAIFLAVRLMVGEETVIGKIPLWHIGSLIAIVTGVIWIERILVRMYLSHAHLATDAGERVAMAKTYLALVRDGKVTDDKDRRVILDALFRKATTGIVKDDGAPPSLFEMMPRQR